MASKAFDSDKNLKRKDIKTTHVPFQSSNFPQPDLKVKQIEDPTHVAWILGKKYYLPRDQDSFNLHAESIFRFTYRKDFPQLLPYSISSDSGWGCMLRAAQMMMGQSFIRHYFGADWRLPLSRLMSDDKQYCEILRWFMDYPGIPHYYALHHIIQCGMKYDKLPGEWYGPSTASLVLRDLSKLHRLKYQGPLAIYVAQGDTIYISEVEKLCSNLSLNDCLLGISESETLLKNSQISTKINQLLMKQKEMEEIHLKKKLKENEKNEHFKEKRENLVDPLLNPKDENSSEDENFFDPLFHIPPSFLHPWLTSLLVLMPLRLGIDSVNSEYYPELKEFLQHPNSVGIIGGRVNHAIYFVGYKDNILFGHDPHTVYSNPTENGNIFPSNEYINQIHTKGMVPLGIDSLDPSLAIGFYFSSRSEFEIFCTTTRQRIMKMQQSGKTILYQIEHSPPSYMQDEFVFDEENMTDFTEMGLINAMKQPLRATQTIDTSLDFVEPIINSDDEDESEYVFL